MTENFVIEISFRTPMLAAARLTGDGILAGVAYQEHGDWVRSIAELPVETWKGVPHMSVALPYTYATRNAGRVTIIRSIMRDMDHNPDMANMLHTMPSRSSLRPDSGVLSNISSSYTLYDVPKIYFLGRGDLAQVKAAFDNVPFIGPQHAKGFGEVQHVDAWVAKTNNPFYGIVGRHGDRSAVLRPVPERLREYLPEDVKHVMRRATWHNPYWPGHATAVVEDCLTPNFVTGEGFSVAAIEMLGHL